MLQSGTPGAPVSITSDKPISVASTIYLDNRVQVAEVVPLQELGVEYYVLTPPGKSDEDNKHISIANFQVPNIVEIYPTETVNFKGKTYEPGSKITIELKPFEVILLKSKGNPSGTRVLATHPVVVTCGYSSADTVFPSYQVSTQLLPVSRWGKEYLFPSLAYPGSTDVVFIVASRPSQVEYQVDDHKQSRKMKAGEVIQIVVPESSTVSITAEVKVQVIYFRKGDKTHEPSFINVPDKKQYSTIYAVVVYPKFEKTVLVITVETSAVHKITIDGNPVPNIEWKPIPGTVYSTAIYNLGKEPGTHIVEAPDSPFGLMTLGYPKQQTTVDEKSSAPVGTDFVIPTPTIHDEKNPVKFEFQVTAKEPTTVTINYEPAKLKKELTLQKGQTTTININIPPGMLLKHTGASPFIITSASPISLIVIFHIGTRVETIEPVPLQQQGVEYYVLTPPGKSGDDDKEFSIGNFHKPNSVAIIPTGTVVFQGQTYKPGRKITITLKPFEVVLIESKYNLSGTSIKATTPIAVVSGYSSPETVSPSYQVSTPLHPVTQWGKEFLFLSLAKPGNTDKVFVIASQTSNIQYQVGDHKQSLSMKAGQVTEIEIPEFTTISITGNKPLQVTYYSTPGKTGDRLYETYLINIPDTTNYAPKYTVTSNPDFEKNRAILIVKTSAVPLITFDGKSLSMIEWKPIPGTGYSIAIYDFGNKPSTHMVEAPDMPFGLLIIRYPKQPAIEKPEGPSDELSVPDLSNTEDLSAEKPTSDEKSSAPVGTDFVIPTPTIHDEKNPVKFEFQVTAKEPTTVTINYEPAKLKKELSLEKGQTTTITINIPPGMLLKHSGASPFIITSASPISLIVIFHIGSHVETIEPVPLQQQGVEYYVLTPPGKSGDDDKEFSIGNFKKPNSVAIIPTGTVVFQGQTYKPGRKITITLKPFEVILIKSKDNLSGTSIKATTPIAVVSGYSSPETVSPSYQVSTPLHPVTRWGKQFFFLSLAKPGNTDKVFVVASKPTNIQYQVGDHKQSLSMKAGQVTEIEIPEFTTISITGNSPVQVTYYSTPGKTGDRLYETYLINIPDSTTYAPKYTVTSNPDFEKNRAILIVKTSAVPLITFDGKSLSMIEWKPIPVTGYSIAIYDFGNKPSTHMVEAPNMPFGLLIIRYPKQPAIEKPEGPSDDEKSSAPVGTDFVIFTPTIHDEKNPVKFEFQVTAKVPTTVTINYEPAKLKKELTLEKGQTTTITINIPPGMLLKHSGASPFIITSASPISLIVIFHIGSHVETIEPVPLQHQGVEYYVLTPPGKSGDDDKEFSIGNFQKPNSVAIIPTGTVVFQGQTYKPGRKITITLKPFEVILIKSKDNLSGTSIKATTPIAVVSGYSSPETVSPSYQVSTPLHPVTRWGKQFFFLSLAKPGNTDKVFVVASKPTNIQYQVGDHKQSLSMKDGQVTEIEIPEFTTISITGNEPVQVTYYSTPGKTGDRLYENYLINIPDSTTYAPKYTVTSNPDFEKNRAILIVKTSAVPLITFDGKSLSMIEWKPIPGTGYSIAIYDFGNKPSTHMVEAPDMPFGLLIIRYPKQPAIEKPEGPSDDEKSSAPVGTDFVIPTPTIHDEKNPVKFEFQVTAKEPTTVTINYEPAKLKKELSLEKGQTTTITINIPPGMLLKHSGASPFIITSASPISLIVIFHIGSHVETIEPVPLQHQGVEYYVLTPPGKSGDDDKEFSIGNFQKPNSVAIIPTGTVVFQGQTYKPGRKITITLKPFEVILIKSKDNLSGTSIKATTPIAVVSGYSSPETVSPSYQVSTPLHPVTRWGKQFFFLSLAKPGNTDKVFVVASKPTNIQYQVGDHKQSLSMKAGQVTEIEIPEFTTISIKGNSPVQVTYYSTPGKTGDRLYETYLINIPDSTTYAPKYTVTSNPDFEKNRAILIVKTSAVPLITFDGKSLSMIEWKPIPGTGYSIAIYDFGNKPSTHMVEAPNMPFGLLIIRYPKQPAIEKPEGPSDDEKSSAPVGTDFVILTPTIHDEKNPVKFEFQVTAKEPTTVTINYEPAKLKKELTLEKGQTTTITINIPPGMLLKHSGASPFIITSASPISLIVIFHIGSHVETIEPVPLQHQGVEYYVLTPPGKSGDDDKEFSIGNFQKPNSVAIIPTGTVVFQGQTYKPGRKITITLKPFEVILIKSKDNLSGTSIKATTPIAVVSGYSSPETVSPSYQVSTPLHPVTRWGKQFFFLSLAKPGNTDKVFVVASKPTNIQYQVGDHKQSLSMKDGQVTEIEIPEFTTISITGNEPVQVTYYSTPGKTGDRLYENYLINIPDSTTYAPKYTVTSNPDFEKNRAILIVKTSAVPLITFDGKSLSMIEWKPIPGTGYSIAIYDFGNKPSTHMVEAPDMPFGLLIIRYPKQPAIEKPEGPSDDEKSSAPVGTDFVIPTPTIHDEKNPVKFEFQVTAKEPTTVTINYEPAKLKKELSLEKGQTTTITINIPPGMLLKHAGASPFIITSASPISLIVIFHIGSHVETIEPVPLQQQGVEYYVLTPPGKSGDDDKEFSIGNFQKPNSVAIIPTGTVVFQGQTYKPGRKITITLKPFEVILIKSKDNLSGTSIKATTPIAVVSGYSSPETVSPSYQVSTPLHPVTRWGKQFFFLSLAKPGNTDKVFVVASKPTNIQYQVGDHKQRLSMKDGQVTEIEIPEFTTISITGNEPVQVTYYSTPGKTGDRLYENYLINIPDSTTYAPKYTVTSNPDFEKNRAILIVKTSAVPLITFDGKSLSMIGWKPIPGTGYSIAIYDFGNKPSTHIVEAPDMPFGLLIIRYPKQPAIEKPEGPSDDEKSSAPVGTDFVIPTPTIHDEKNPVKFEFQVTAKEPTTVTINYEPAKLKKELSLEKGQTTTITINIPPGMLLKHSGASPFIITSASPISLIVIFHIGSHVETIEPVPLQQQGVEYYVLTPPGKSGDDDKEFSIGNFQKPNSVAIIPTGTVVFQGQTYKPGRKITITLKPFEVILIKSKDNLSGTSIKATTPIAVVSGYSSPETVSPSYQVSTPLHPVTRWGKQFFFLSLAKPGNTDKVFVVASKPTNIQYQVGDHKQSLSMKAGQVTEIEIPEFTTISITGNEPVQVTYYSTPGKTGDRLYENYLINIPDSTTYAPKYTVTSNPDFEKNRAILIVKTSAVPLITFDGKSLSMIEWKPIPGTGYSIAIYDFGNKPSTHMVEAPNMPFGLLIIRYPKQPAIEKPEGPSDDEKSSAPVGTDFVIFTPTIHDEKNPVKFEFQVTAKEPTTVTINYEPAKLKKELTLEKGQTTTITINIPPGMLLKHTGASPFIITSASPISLIVIFHIGSRVETIEPVPLQQQGVVYYVLTPPGKSGDDDKEFSIGNFQKPNSVAIIPTGTVVFQGQTYKPGRKITITLKPFEVILIKSKDNLSGTSIKATTPIAVVSGYSSPETVSPSYQVSTPLHPVTRWGKEFFFLSLAKPGNTDKVFVVASKPTNIQYQVGDHKQSLSMKAGQVTEIKIPEFTTISITGNEPVQVTYYSTPGKTGDRLYETYLINIPDSTTYAPKYTVTSNPDFEKNLAILIVKTSAVPLITFDGKSLSMIEWKPIPGTGYSIAIYDFGNKPSTHMVEAPDMPFGLLIIRYPKQPAIEKPEGPSDELNVPDLSNTEDLSAEKPTSGEKSPTPVGKDFVIPTPTIHDEKNPVKFEFQITAQEPTTVTIIYVPANLKKEVTLQKGQATTITINIPPGMLLKQTGAAPFIITSESSISLTVIIYIGSRVETITPVPLQQQGVEYYVLTPPGKSGDDDKEVSIGNFQKPNNVDIYPTATVVCEGQTYKPGRKIAVSLKPFEVIRLKSKDNLSGTRINATKPITVLSGYSSPESVTPSYQVSTSLHPVTQWGQNFFFTSLAISGNTDMVFVVAYQLTNIQFQVGDHKQSQTLKAGEVTQIGIPEFTTIFITANHPVQVTYYCTAGKIGARSYDSFLLNIPPKSEYSPKYIFISNPTLEKNRAILIVKTSAVPLITFDGKSLSNIEWKTIPGTQYSVAIYDFGNEPTTHVVEAPGKPFGLVIIGFPKQPAIEKPERPTTGEQPTAPAGKEFVIPSPTTLNQKEVKLEFRVTAYEDQTKVSLVYELIKLKREFTLRKRQTAAVSITIPAEMLAMGKDTSSIVIKSDKPISVVTETFRGTQSETSEIIPLQKVGSEYYVVTPSVGEEGDKKEFSVTNYEGKNKVGISLTGRVEYQGKIYTPGNTLTLSLESFQEVHFQSKDDLSGTRIESTQPVAVSSGYSCSGKVTPCHVSFQLLPTSRWGTQFFVPSLAFQGRRDIVFIVASQYTQLGYQVGERKLSQSLKAGEVLRIELPESHTVSITASAGVLVMYYCTGGKIGERSYEPFLMNIPDLTHYGTSYQVIGNPHLEKNIAVLVVKTSALSQITFDGKSLSNISWKSFPGTEYSWGKHDFGIDAASHTVELDNTPFGLMIIGYRKGNAK
ncbi:uncharacterized protein LOC144769654 [Lissotriton helveticus]